jgi:DNA-binding IclR family transcriptional regulator
MKDCSPVRHGAGRRPEPAEVTVPVVRSAPGESVTYRALGLLDAFDTQHRVLSLSQVARRTGVPLATAQRRLRDLVDGRLLEQRDDGLYEIGARMWQLGLLSRPTSMREAALPHLQDLVARTGRTVHLAVLDGHAALVVDRLAGARTVPTRHLPGARLPLHCTGVGKALLAFAPQALQDRVLAALVPHTRYTVTDPDAVRSSLARVRRTRLAESRQQHRLGVHSLAAPVFGSDGEVTAAVGLLGPVDTPLSRDAEPLRACARAVARAVEAFEARWFDK